MIPLDPAILEFDYEWREGDRLQAIQIAVSFVNLYRDQLTPLYSKYTLEDLVHEIDELRKCGAERHHDRLVTDMWILSEYPLQHITCEGHPTVPLSQVFSRSKVNGNV